MICGYCKSKFEMAIDVVRHQKSDLCVIFDNKSKFRISGVSKAMKEFDLEKKSVNRGGK